MDLKLDSTKFTHNLSHELITVFESANRATTPIWLLQRIAQADLTPNDEKCRK